MNQFIMLDLVIVVMMMAGTKPYGTVQKPGLLNMILLDFFSNHFQRYLWLICSAVNIDLSFPVWIAIKF